MKAEEKYRIRLLGSFAKGTDRVKSVNYLAKQFGVPAKRFGKYFDAKPRVVKRGLRLDQAKKHAAVFQKAGALYEIDLDLTPQTFRESIHRLSASTPDTAKPVPEKEPVAPQKAGPKSNTESESVFSFERYFITPLILAFPYSVELTDNNGKSAGFVESGKLGFGWLLTLFLSVNLALEALSWLLDYTFMQSHSGYGYTIFNILGFLALLLFLPKYLRPRKRVAIHSGGPGDATVFCSLEETWFGSGVKKNFLVKDADGETKAVISKELVFSRYKCAYPDGRTAFSVDIDRELGIDASATSVAQILRDNLVDLGYVGDMILSKVDPEIRPKRWIIRNENLEEVGTFKKESTCVLTVRKEHFPDDEIGIVSAFAMVLAGL